MGAPTCPDRVPNQEGRHSIFAHVGTLSSSSYLRDCSAVGLEWVVHSESQGHIWLMGCLCGWPESLPFIDVSRDRTESK